MIPFFFLNIKKGADYHVFNPVYNTEYIVNYMEYRILEQCDGEHTPDEIADSFVKDFGKIKAEATDYITAFLDKMCRLGMIARRYEKIEYLQILSPPSRVFWDITGKCNLRCVHCYNINGQFHENELSTEEIKRVIEEMAAFGVEQITFSGGEPLMRKDFFDIALFTSNFGFNYVSVATNGILIDHKIAKLLKKANLSVQVSIDGDTAEVHDEQRGVKGAFDQGIHGIKLLKEVGVNTSVCTVATKLNIDRISGILQLMQHLGVKDYRVQSIMPMGMGKKNIERLGLTPGMLKGLMEYLQSKNISNLDYEITFRPPPEVEIDFSWSGACSAGNSICSITPEGNVVPCTCFWGINGDNLRDHSFQWIWENSRILNYFRSFRLDDIKGVCRECKWLSLCNGGCKAENYAHGDIFGSSRSCWVAEEMRQKTAHHQDRGVETVN